MPSDLQRIMILSNSTNSYSKIKSVLAPEEMSFEVVTRTLLMSEKVFIKLLRKTQPKDLEMMSRRHQKDKAMMLRQHSTVVDKMVATHQRDKTAIEKSMEKKLKKNM